MKGTLHEDQYTFLIIPRSFFHRMRNVSEPSCREYQNTHFVFSNFFDNRIVYVIKWKKKVAALSMLHKAKKAYYACCAYGLRGTRTLFTRRQAVAIAT